MPGIYIYMQSRVSILGANGGWRQLPEHKPSVIVKRDATNGTAMDMAHKLVEDWSKTGRVSHKDFDKLSRYVRKAKASTGEPQKKASEDFWRHYHKSVSTVLGSK